MRRPVSKLPNLEARQALGAAVLTLLDRWGVADNQKAQLLQIAAVDTLRAGGPLPADEVVLERAQHLVEIHHALWELYPYQGSFRDSWVAVVDYRLGDQPALAMMLNEGTEGMLRVRDFLEGRLAVLGRRWD